MITEPLFYLFAVIAVLLYGMSKGGLGGGPSMVGVPLMALVVAPFQAAAVLLPILVVMDFTAIWKFRGQWHWGHLKTILPGAVAGIVIGSFSFGYLSDDAVRIIIGAISLAFGLEYWLRRSPRAAASPHRLKGSFWAMVSGFTSFGVHAGGPPISIYLLPLGMEKKQLMATFALFFTVVNLVKLIPYGLLGQLSFGNLATSLVLMPIAPVGVLIGYWLLERISTLWVYRISYAFLVLVGIKLLWEGSGV